MKSDTPGYKKTVAILHDRDPFRTFDDENEVPFDWQIGDLILNKYKVLDICGEGGMGIVYRVYHLDWNMELAVKNLIPELANDYWAKDDFRKEAETWINLGLHQNIVRCCYVRSFGSRERIFVEFIDGGSLTDWISTGKLYKGSSKACLERMLGIALQVAWGLSYAHDKGVIHQDIKPSNILLTSDGIAKITDFGLSRTVPAKMNAETGHNRLVKNAGMTKAYASPEQLEGMPLSYKTDIWSWAVSVLEMFLGRVDWSIEGTTGHFLEKYLESKKEDEGIPKIPDSFARILRECFCLNPADRPESMKKIANDLQDICTKIIGHSFDERLPKSATLLADNLNNKAITFLDLGRKADAQKYWKEALLADPGHLETTFNLGYYLWSNAQISDTDLLRQLNALSIAQRDNRDFWKCLAWIQLERGDLDSINEIKSKNKFTDDYFDKAYNDPLAPIGIKLANFRSKKQNTMSVITSASMSLDGRLALTGHDESTRNDGIKIWDVKNIEEIEFPKGDNKVPGPYIHSLCISPDQKTALISDDNSVTSWDTDVWSMQAEFKPSKTNPFTSLGFSLDGKYILLGGGYDGAIYILDKKLCLVSDPLRGHSGSVLSVAFSPERDKIISSSLDGTIRIWDANARRAISRLENGATPVFCFFLSPNGKRIYSGSGDGVIRVWDIDSGKIIRELTGHRGEIKSICISPNEQLLYSVSRDDGRLRVWEIETGRIIREILIPGDEFSYIARSSDDPTVLTAGKSSGLVKWKFNYEPKFIKEGHPYPMLSKIRHLSELSTADEKAANLLSDAQIYLDARNYKNAYRKLRDRQMIFGYERNQRTLELLVERENYSNKRVNIRDAWLAKRLVGHVGPIPSVAFSPDNRFILSGSYDTSVILWDFGGKELQQIISHVDQVNSVCFTPDGQCFLSAGGTSKRGNLIIENGRIDPGQVDGNENSFYYWKLDNTTTKRKFLRHSAPIRSIDISLDGKSIITGSGGWIHMWDVQSGSLVKSLITDGFSFVKCFKNTSKVLTGGHHDICLWDLSSGTKLWEQQGYAKERYSPSFSPDYSLVASVNYEGGVLVLDSASGDIVFNQDQWFNNSNDAKCTFVNFSPDGNYLLVGKNDGIVQIWKYPSAELVAELVGHNGTIMTASFSSDSRFVIASGIDDVISLWEIDWECDFS